MVKKYVYFEVGAEFWNVIYINFMLKILQQM